MVKLALLGATGSIGSSTLEVLREHPDEFSLVLASAHGDWQKLCSLAEEFKVPLLILTGIEDRALRERLRSQYPRHHFHFGTDELLQALRGEDYDLALNAISGSAGLLSSFAVLERGKPLALANKESLVLAGHLISPLVKSKNIPLLPVDSEHSAVFQAMGSHPVSEIRRLHLTASGGAFRALPLPLFGQITPSQALKHPNWDMGAKVTLDSATMFNKALEVMEAHWLFGLPYAAIGAVIHPQSVIHSLVEFIDGSLLAQLSTPDMKLPILYAFSWPRRLPSDLVRTNLLELPELTFQPIEPERYPLYYLGLEAARQGGIHPTAINSANEAAIQLFLRGRIPFTHIHRLCDEALQRTLPIPDPDLDTILEVNDRVYRETMERVEAGN
jgi:1-deoxy-D-xylulose-5-phosphate reductoisomerase